MTLIAKAASPHVQWNEQQIKTSAFLIHRIDPPPFKSENTKAK
jgi:hypothetical protein